MLSKFSCSGREELCLFNSTCSKTGDFCECPPGINHDFVFFHQPNCGVPDYTYLIFFCSYLIPWLSVGYFLVRELSRARNKSILWFGLEGLVFHCSLLLLTIGLLAQGGFYELAAMAGALTNISMFRLVVQMLIIMFTCSYGIYQDRVNVMSNLLRALSLVHFFMESALAFTIVCLCRTEHLAMHDTLAFAIVMPHYLSLVIVAIIALKFTNEFLRDLEKQKVIDIQASRPEFVRILDEVRKRIVVLKHRWIACLGLLSVISISTLCVRATLTSMPFMFAPFLLMIFIAPLATHGVVAIFPRITDCHISPNHRTS